MELSRNIKRAADRYEPIETAGVTLWPIRVSEMDEFELARPAVDIVQQALPVRYAAMPLLSAYWVMDMEALERGKEPVGLFNRALAFLALALRLGEDRPLSDRIRLFHVKLSAENTKNLKAISFTWNGEEEISITPVKFQRLRAILAYQNGIELTDEDANPDLLEAEAELARRNGPKLKRDTAELISAVAALTGIEETDIDEWPILKLRRRQKALQRAADYLICGISEGSGTKWKGGNPVPHLFYDREREDAGAMTPLSQFTNSEQISKERETT